MKRHEVRLLREAGLAQARVAETSEVSERTVRRIEGEDVLPPSMESLAKARGVGRPSKAEPFRSVVEGILKAEPSLPTVEVLHRVKERGYAGGKSALYGLVAELRSPAESPMVRFEGLPGEFSQHDFGHVDVRFFGAHFVRALLQRGVA